MIILLPEPVTIANPRCESLKMQIYGFDNIMAPAGKGVIKMELDSVYAFWKQLYTDKQKYNADKQKVGTQVIDILERRFLRHQESGRGH